jgi:hypothetical protein
MAYKFNPFTGNLDVTPFSLNGAGKIPSSYLPSYVDDAIEYANLAGFPGTGETGKIYVAQDTGYTYRWTGSVYVRIGSGGEVELNLGSTGSPSLFFNGDVNTGLYSPGADQVAVATNGAERLRIDSSGNVGIGTTSPSTPLEIASSGTTNALISAFDATASRAYFQVGGTTSGRYTQIGTDTSTTFINDYFGTGIAFQLAASEKARIDSDGRLLVGTSTSIPVGGANGSNIQLAGSVAFQSQSRWATGNGGPNFILGKSRSATPGSYTIVQDDDGLGTITFAGDDGTDLQSVAARIQGFVDGIPGADDMPGRLVFSTTPDGAASPTERMRINSEGRTDAFGTSETLRVRTAATTAAASIAIRLQAGATSITAGGTTEFQVTSNGNVANTTNSYGAISDIKLKENIVDANSQWNDLKALQVRNYNFKEGQTHTQIGLVAQEAELVSPGLVNESPDYDAEGNDLGTVTKSVNYSVLYMKAVKALQEAMERIETFEQRLSDAGIA